ncbi:MAG: rhodanese homology domain-containing protein [Gammaproteobacteria bacterium]
MEKEITYRDYEYVRSSLLDKKEIALLDVREEAPHAQGHPLFAANFPSSRIELDAYTKLPRMDVPIVLIDGGEGLAEICASRFESLGYTDVTVFSGGIDGWVSAGGELFIDVNVPSKSFGEYMEACCQTPSIPAHEAKALIESDEDVAVLDVRRFDEYQTMSIPTATSVPGAELVLRVADMVPNADTTILVNCAGRTRSLLGTQSLINAGIPNPVAALRNGTIGWTLAGQTLETGQSRSYPATSNAGHAIAKQRARTVADRAGVKRVSVKELAAWREQQNRTSYFFDVRSAEEYEQSHIPGFFCIQGGQLVQETEMYAPVRGARIVVVDDDGTRANMSASWLAQMAWDVYVLDDATPEDFTQSGKWQAKIAEGAKPREVSVAEVRAWQNASKEFVVIDFSKHAAYAKGHIPGSYYALRCQLKAALKNIPDVPRYVITDEMGLVGQFVAPELAALVSAEIFVLAGGTAAWQARGMPMETGETRLASPPLDRYKRPYEGTNVPPEAMQAYLDWEFGLIEQLNRDGTHHFKPMTLRD